MKWIWAKDRLPDKGGSYHIRDYRYRNNGTFSRLVSYFNCSYGKSLIRTDPHLIQWLDESEDEAVEPMDKAIEHTHKTATKFLEWYNSLTPSLSHHQPIKQQQ